MSKLLVQHNRERETDRDRDLQVREPDHRRL